MSLYLAGISAAILKNYFACGRMFLKKMKIGQIERLLIYCTVYGDMVEQCPIVLPTCREDRSVWQIYVVGTETLSSIETLTSFRQG